MLDFLCDLSETIDRHKRRKAKESGVNQARENIIYTAPQQVPLQSCLYRFVSICHISKGIFGAPLNYNRAAPIRKTSRLERTLVPPLLTLVCQEAPPPLPRCREYKQQGITGLAPWEVGVRLPAWVKIRQCFSEEFAKPHPCCHRDPSSVSRGV